MDAIKQIVEVKNHQIKVELPENFDAEFVEVIIFRKENDFDFEISEEEKELMRKRISESKEKDFEDWDSVKHNYL
jgi:hypothetical protein